MKSVSCNVPTLAAGESIDASLAMEQLDITKNKLELSMDVKQAVTQAKLYIAGLFEYEDPTNIGLEEIILDEDENAWAVTIGFSRRWDGPPRKALMAISAPATRREYKVVRIANDSGQVLSVKNREPLR